MADTSLILVNYRTEDHVEAALRHLAILSEEQPAQIVVADNSPGNGLAARLERFPRTVEYLASQTNLGFAGGVNLGLARARGEIVVLLNPDARPEHGCLSGLVRILGCQPRAAVAGPKLVPFEAGAPLTPSATRRDPGLIAPLIEYTPLRRFFPRDWLSRHYHVDPETTHEVTECAMVQGACFAVKRSWLDRVGRFDAERFFLYWEETDFCRRVRTSGGLVLYCPQLVCRHVGGASVGRRGQDVARYWRSFYAYQSKHHGRLRTLALRGLLTTGIAVEHALLLAKRRFGSAGADRELRDYADVVRHRLLAHLGRGPDGR